MAECQGCTISKLLGIADHSDYMSENETLWWIARSTMKPLPSVRSDIYESQSIAISSINHNTGESMIDKSIAPRTWFKDNSEEGWRLALEENRRLNEELRKNGPKKDNGANST